MISPSGTIALFWGLPAAIPTGWKSCDGTEGTPDLRDRLIIGAGGLFGPHAGGGSATHNHAFTSDGHSHTQRPWDTYAYGTYYKDLLDSRVLTGTTNNATLLPPYMALIYIQKI